jgi:hypothetical protein
VLFAFISASSVNAADVLRREIAAQLTRERAAELEDEE